MLKVTSTYPRNAVLLSTGSNRHVAIVHPIIVHPIISHLHVKFTYLYIYIYRCM